MSDYSPCCQGSRPSSLFFMSQFFTTQFRLKFREADAIQIMYFANIFSIAHDVFEEFLLHLGYSWTEWFQQKDFIMPIRHTEADYRAPLFPGHHYHVKVQVEKLGTSSFTMKYEFYDEKETQLHAIVRMTHAFADAKTKTKTSVPELFVQRIQPYLARS